MAARLTAQQKTLRTITERQFQTTVEGIMSLNGWRFFHAPNNSPRIGRSGQSYVQNVKAGWPDLFAIRGERAIAAELKREDGKTTPAQDEWLKDLRFAGIETYIWRPRDLEDLRRILAKNNH